MCRFHLKKTYTPRNLQYSWQHRVSWTTALYDLGLFITGFILVELDGTWLGTWRAQFQLARMVWSSCRRISNDSSWKQCTIFFESVVNCFRSSYSKALLHSTSLYSAIHEWDTSIIKRQMKFEDSRRLKKIDNGFKIAWYINSLIANRSSQNSWNMMAQLLLVY